MAAPAKTRQIQLVGRKIRELRKQRKLTQVELSAQLGIQQSDLSRMEKGEYRVSLDTLFRILDEFKMSIGEFFEEVAKESITPRDTRLIQTSGLCTRRLKMRWRSSSPSSGRRPRVRIRLSGAGWRPLDDER